jgi:hypothetical protein
MDSPLHTLSIHPSPADINAHERQLAIAHVNSAGDRAETLSAVCGPSLVASVRWKQSVEGVLTSELIRRALILYCYGKRIDLPTEQLAGFLEQQQQQQGVA